MNRLRNPLYSARNLCVRLVIADLDNQWVSRLSQRFSESAHMGDRALMGYIRTGGVELNRRNLQRLEFLSERLRLGSVFGEHRDHYLQAHPLHTGVAGAYPPVHSRIG